METNNIQYISCPCCSTQIPFTVAGLLRGESFMCPRCQALISLSQRDTSIVQDAMKKLEELKSSHTAQLK